MKTGMMGDNIGELNDEDKTFLGLIQSCKLLECFQFNDVIVLGNRVAIVKRYFDENVKTDFAEWLISEYECVKKK